MSAFVDVDVEIKNETALVNALRRMGYEQLRHGRQKLVGYQGDQRKEEADIVVDRRHLTSASNDLGFRKEEGGKWKMIISEYDKSALSRKHEGGFEKQFKSAYSVEVSKLALKKQKYKVTETVQDDGTVELVAVRWAK